MVILFTNGLSCTLRLFPLLIAGALLVSVLFLLVLFLPICGIGIDMCNRKPMSIKAVSIYAPKALYIPCGECFECRGVQRSAWTFRLRAELEPLDIFVSTIDAKSR